VTAAPELPARPHHVTCKDFHGVGEVVAGYDHQGDGVGQPVYIVEDLIGVRHVELAEDVTVVD
jgi:anaerobic glycerol-3-phosphate dehydrogenase